MTFKKTNHSDAGLDRIYCTPKDVRPALIDRLIKAQRTWAEKQPGSPTAEILAEALGEIRELRGRLARDT